MEGNALSYFDVLTAINLYYISVTMKQKHCELVLQVSLRKLQCSMIKPNYVHAICENFFICIPTVHFHYGILEHSRDITFLIVLL